MFFLENLLPGDPLVDAKQTTTDLGQPSSSANRVAARHYGVGNLTFVDGHSQAYKGKQVVQTQSGPGEGGTILPQTDIIWTQDTEFNAITILNANEKGGQRFYAIRL